MLRQSDAWLPNLRHHIVLAISLVWTGDLHVFEDIQSSMQVPWVGFRHLHHGSALQIFLATYHQFCLLRDLYADERAIDSLEHRARHG